MTGHRVLSHRACVVTLRSGHWSASEDEDHNNIKLECFHASKGFFLPLNVKCFFFESLFFPTIPVLTYLDCASDSDLSCPVVQVVRGLGAEV